MNSIKKFCILVVGLTTSVAMAVPVYAQPNQDQDKHEVKNVVAEAKHERNDLRKELQNNIKMLRLHTKDELRRLAMVQGKLLSKSGDTAPAELSVELSKFVPQFNKGERAMASPALKTSLAVKVTADTKLQRKGGGTSSLSEMNVGDQVTVVGRFNEDGTLTARLVLDASLQMRAEKRGLIISLNPSAMTFILVSPPERADNKQFTVHVTPSTTITAGDGTAQTFADLKVNQQVSVAGMFNSTTNVLEAKTIKIINPKPEAFTFHGTLSAMGATTVPTSLTITLAGPQPAPLTDERGEVRSLVGPAITVNVDEHTKLVRHFGGASALSEFSVGDMVSVRGHFETLGAATSSSANAVITASEVRDESIQHADKKGFITSVDTSAKTITLNWSEMLNILLEKITVQVTDATKISVPGKDSATFADLKVGQESQVSGVLNTRTNILKADSVKVISASTLPLGVTITGRLASAPSTTLPTTLTITIDGVTPERSPLSDQVKAWLEHNLTITVDANATLFDHVWNRITLSALAAGDKLYIGGQLLSDGSVHAALVKDDSIPHPATP